MDIVVIDNLHWGNEGAALNSPKPYYVVTAEKSFEETAKNLADFSEVYSSSTDLVYLINVHCVFEGEVSKKQEKQLYGSQNGIGIYRQLLKLYKDQERHLKAVFFSPLKTDYLTQLHPENAVLEHHLVFQTPFHWEGVLEAIDEYDRNKRWTPFNNASENLLSGWALSGQEKIKTNGKKFILIDDQCEEWQAAIEQVVDDRDAFHFANYEKERSPATDFSPDKIYDSKRDDSSLFKTKLYHADVVISDFYLQESHEIDNWRSYDELENISGARLLQYIREDLRVGVPVVMHTSSNKVRYYQFMDGKGIDGWMSKDIRPEPSEAEMRYNYQLFRRTIEKFAVGKHAEVYRRLKTVWKRIQKIGSRGRSNWWFTDSEYPCAPANGIKKLSRSDKSVLIELLVDCYFAIQMHVRREDAFVGPGRVPETNFGPTAIAVGLGKIYELLQLSDLPVNQHQAFLRRFRNIAAHDIVGRSIRIEDTLAYLHYWLLALESESDTLLEAFPRNGEWIGFPQYSSFKLLYLWILFYNTDTRPDRGVAVADERIANTVARILKAVDHSDLHAELCCDEPVFDELQKRIAVAFDDTAVGSFKVVVENGRLGLGQLRT